MIFNKRIRSLEEKVEELEATLDKVLKAIDSESFLEDFEKFQKFNQSKDKLPTVEVYMSLQRFKIEMDKYQNSLTAYIQNRSRSSENMMYDQLSKCERLISQIRKSLRDHKINTDELLLWYGFSSDDLEKFVKPLNKE